MQPKKTTCKNPFLITYKNLIILLYPYNNSMKNKDFLVSPLRFNYSLVSKSTKSTKFKKEYHESLESTSLCNTNRHTISPKKKNTELLTAEISRLEDELDSEEISLKIYEIRKLTDTSRNAAEAQIYENYIDKLLHCICQSDQRLGRSILRGWKGYKKTIKQSYDVVEIPITQSNIMETKDAEAQFPEDQALAPDLGLDIDKCIYSLHNVMKGINQMQLGRIISKLNDLSYELKPVDVPSLSSSPEIDVLDFTDTIKAIHTKLKAHINLKKPKKNKVPSEKVEKDTQTFLKIEDFKTIESMKIIITEKENIIAELSNKLRNKGQVEEMLIIKNREYDELKNMISDIKGKVCQQCKYKKKKLDENQAEIKALQNNAVKGVNVEKELETTKNKLHEYLNIITTKNLKIGKLTEDLEDLSKRIAESKAQRCELEEKLSEEEKIKEAMQRKLMKSPEKTFEMREYFGGTGFGVKGTEKNTGVMDFSELEGDGKSNTKILKIFEKIVDKNLDKNKSISPIDREWEFRNRTPSVVNRENCVSRPSPLSKKRIFIRERLIIYTFGLN